GVLEYACQTELVGRGFSDLCGAAAISSDSGRRGISGADRDRVVHYRSRLVPRRDRAAASYGLSAVSAVLHGSDPVDHLQPDYLSVATAGLSIGRMGVDVNRHPGAA